jgi:hypothetical protein
MKPRLLALAVLFGIGSILTAAAEHPNATVKELISELHARCPNNWLVSYNPDLKGIEIKRKKAVLVDNTAPNVSGAEKAERVRPWYFLKIMPFLSPEKFKKLSAEDNAVRDRMDELVKRDPDSRHPNFGYEGPNTPEYKKLKSQLHDLPNFSYRDVSLGWIAFDVYCSPVEAGDRKECEDVLKKIEAVLTKY